MKAVKLITGRAVPFDRDNVDTDLIIPSSFCRGITREGLGKGLFYHLRYSPTGETRPDCVLNNPALGDARIMVAARNFGCGSSREHAVWALQDWGIACVIATSFGEIFYENSVKNGLCPIVLPAEECEALRQRAAEGAEIAVDLVAQIITSGNVLTIPFHMPTHKREMLLNGWDPIDQALALGSEITAHECLAGQNSPWRNLDGDQS